MDQISIAVAFVAGLLSFLSPCILPMVPVYLATLSGTATEDTGGRRFNIFFHSLSFVIGFTIVFTFLGAGFGLTGFAFGNHVELIRNISGSLLIFFGVFILASQKISWLNYEKHLRPATGRTTGYLRSFIIGGVFTLAWTPCVGPILGSILTLALESGTAYQGAYLLAIYSLGLGLPFLVFGATFDAVSPFLKKLNRHSGVIYMISAVLFIATGILILLDKLTWLQGL